MLKLNFTEIIEEIQTEIAEKRVNFLIGSGASYPYFPTLNNIESILTEQDLNSNDRDLVYLLYFLEVINKNIELHNLFVKRIHFVAEATEEVYKIKENYSYFVTNLVKKMSKRNARISPTRANIFTTNYDLFFEIAIDNEIAHNPSAIFNDGGSGVFNRYLSSDNYHKTVSRNGAFDNYHIELPTINLMKCHGSVNWEKGEIFKNNKIAINNNLNLLHQIERRALSINLLEAEIEKIKNFLYNPNSVSLDEFKKISEKYNKETSNFFDLYQQLMIINPEKTKFKNTLIEEHYYSMLRLLSYELERDQSILIVFGFSFADEHVRNLIKRSIYNPGLKVYIFVYRHGQKESMNNLLECRNLKNIEVIEPEDETRNMDFNYLNELIFGGFNT